MDGPFFGLELSPSPAPTPAPARKSGPPSRVAAPTPALPPGALPSVGAAPGRVGDLIAALAPRLIAGGEAYFLDGGNVFDPSRLAIRLRRAGVPPEDAFENRVFVSRAFTCHQLVEAAETLLPPLLDRSPPPATFLLGIEKLFLDEDIPLRERRYLFDRLLARTVATRAAGLPVVVSFGPCGGTIWGKILAARTTPVAVPRAALDRDEEDARGPHAADLQHLP